MVRSISAGSALRLCVRAGLAMAVVPSTEVRRLFRPPSSRGQGPPQFAPNLALHGVWPGRRERELRYPGTVNHNRIPFRPAPAPGMFLSRYFPTVSVPNTRRTTDSGILRV
jgi:hypothetical protein